MIASDFTAVAERLGRLSQMAPELQAMHEQLGRMRERLGSLLRELDPDFEIQEPKEERRVAGADLFSADPAGSFMTGDPAPAFEQAARNGRLQLRPKPQPEDLREVIPARGLSDDALMLLSPKSAQPSISALDPAVLPEELENAQVIPGLDPGKYCLLPGLSSLWMISKSAKGSYWRRMKWIHCGPIEAAAQHAPVADHPSNWIVQVNVAGGRKQRFTARELSRAVATGKDVTDR